jgi:hypothetical protein
VKWVLVSTLGWAVGWAFVPEFAVGAVIGTAQWVVLKPLIRQDGWWIAASAGGWAAGWAIVLSVFPPGTELLAEAVIGASLGLVQWLVLRQQVHGAWWWIVLSTLGWSVGLMGILGAPLAGAVAGAATGMALEFLLRHPRPEAEHGPPPLALHSIFKRQEEEEEEA